jgi:hypothetical protein
MMNVAEWQQIEELWKSIMKRKQSDKVLLVGAKSVGIS